MEDRQNSDPQLLLLQRKAVDFTTVRISNRLRILNIL